MEREDRVARRENPELILPGARSVIMVGMMYWPGTTGFPQAHHFRFSKTASSSSSTSHSKPRGLVSSYAWGIDYHVELSRRLKQLGRHLNERAEGIGRFYVDTGAILERDFAERAGLGFIGKNSLLINPRVGSGFFIGELFSTIPLPYDGDEHSDGTPTKKVERNRRPRGPGCGKCTKCKDACPTNAIVKDYVVDARRCISYLTIELKGSIPLELRRAMGNRIYGCDICQIVCPWNKFAWNVNDIGDNVVDNKGYSPLFGHVGEQVSMPVLTELLHLDEEAFQKQFRNSAVRRIGRERLVRNVAVALGNVGGVEQEACLQHTAHNDPSNLVREHAKWALHEIHLRQAQSQK